MLNYLRNLKWIDYIIPKSIVIGVDGEVFWKSNKQTHSDQYPTKLAEYLDTERQKRKLSLVGLAKQTGINVEVLRTYIRQGRNPTSKNRRKILDYFGISREDLESMLT